MPRAQSTAVEHQKSNTHEGRSREDQQKYGREPETRRLKQDDEERKRQLPTISGYSKDYQGKAQRSRVEEVYDVQLTDPRREQEN